MRILVAPLEFKGTLSAAQAARALASGLARADQGLELTLLPWADGGPGTLELLLTRGGRRRFLTVQDPLGRPRRAAWAEAGPERSTALLEMAEASGLSLVAPGERDAGRASTYGTGELVRAALDAGFRHILLCVGGSATSDAGVGALSALGARFLDAHGQPLAPGGASLPGLAAVDTLRLDPRLAEARLTVLVDVQNPLLGPQGAARLFAPQKGATPELVAQLEAGHAQLVDVLRKSGRETPEAMPGAGAGGGLPFGLVTLAGAQVAPAFETLAIWAGLDDHLAECDLLLTGEGRLDVQTALGKGPLALCRRAQQLGRRTVLFTGSVAEEAGPLRGAFEDIQVLPVGSEADAADRLSARAEAWARSLPSGQSVARR